MHSLCRPPLREAIARLRRCKTGQTARVVMTDLVGPRRPTNPPLSEALHRLLGGGALCGRQPIRGGKELGC